MSMPTFPRVAISPAELENELLPSMGQALSYLESLEAVGAAEQEALTQAARWMARMLDDLATGLGCPTLKAKALPKARIDASEVRETLAPQVMLVAAYLGSLLTPSVVDQKCLNEACARMARIGLTLEKEFGASGDGGLVGDIPAQIAGRGAREAAVERLSGKLAPTELDKVAASLGREPGLGDVLDLATSIAACPHEHVSGPVDLTYCLVCGSIRRAGQWARPALVDRLAKLLGGA